MIYLFITIDTEASHGFDPLRLMIYGEIGKQRLGIDKIMEICEKYNVLSTFFLDVYEKKFFGEDALIQVAEKIKKRGHDIQLHTHPAWWAEDPRDNSTIKEMKRLRSMYDYNRYCMYHYDLAEQIKILNDGKEIFKRWTGEYPIAHRAGGYGINKDTFLALRESDIPIDSSSFYGHPNCKAVVTKNKIVEHNGIIEIPVTVFKRVRTKKLARLVLKRHSEFIKTDIDWATLDELKWFVQQAKATGIKVMNLFLHSYSFLKFDTNFTKFEPDWGDIEKFDQFLHFISQDHEIQVITMKEFYQLHQNNPELFQGADDVPVYEYN